MEHGAWPIRTLQNVLALKERSKQRRPSGTPANICRHQSGVQNSARSSIDFGSARVVLLGEATHGTSEFYNARAAITRRLIEQHGFSVVAVEADWPDANRVDRHVRHRGPGKYDEECFARFPTWMWRNEEVQTFLEWLRLHNETLPRDKRVEFRGLDVYSLRASIAEVLTYLDRVDPEAAKAARQRYACLTPWQADPAWYGRAVLRGEHDPCEDAVVAQLRRHPRQAAAILPQGRRGLSDAAQNARIVLAAEQYYRIMYRGSTESWNLRDRHMFNTLQHVMDARGPNAKAVVWAHNSHIGNAAATAMGWQGEFNIGELCKAAYGEEAALIGFGTDRGMVAAADDWNEPMRVMRVLPSRPDSYERIFRQTGIARSLTDLRETRRRSSTFCRSRGWSVRSASSTVQTPNSTAIISRPCSRTIRRLCLV